MILSTDYHDTYIKWFEVFYISNIGFIPYNKSLEDRYDPI